MNNRLRNLKWNSLLALAYQVILIATGLILPRCILYFYSSEINGLISSITEFLAFINICDMGISAVVSSAYYKSLADNDTEKISKIFLYSRRFFRVIGFILVGYIAVLLFAYPTFINKSFDFPFTFTLIAAMSISQLGQYFIGISYQLLLSSDQKSYVQLITNGSTLLLNTVVSVILMVCGSDIRIVKLAASIIYLLRPVMMYVYVRSHYKLDMKVKTDGSVVPQKASGVIQHIAYMIYEKTDVMVLTVFSTLQNVSVYAVYTLVTGSIKQIISAATTGVQALLGNMVAKNEKEALSGFFSYYNWIIHTVSTTLFTITGLLIVPFVSIYTSGIADADYHAPLFAALITAAYYLSSIRNCNYVLIRAAGHYRQTRFASLAEALLNLGISIICVFKFGLVGVAVGTLAATMFFVIYEIVYFSKNIVFLPVHHSLKQFLADILTAGVTIAAGVHIKIFNGTIATWILQALCVGIICLCACVAVQLILYRKNLSSLINKFIKKLKR